MSWGLGPLFDINEELIKQLCIENPESAPARIALMVPCFEKEDDGNEKEYFNKWIIWLLDNFGERKDVRDNISSNLGSFSWSGDISPYYERNILFLNSCWIIKNKRYGNGHKNVLITKRSCLTWRKMKRILGR